MQEEERAAIVRANTERFPNGYFETTRRMLGDESFMAVRVVPHPPISCKPWCQGPFDELFATNPEYLEWGVNASASITNLDDVNLQISEQYTEMAEQAIDRKQALFATTHASALRFRLHSSLPTRLRVLPEEGDARRQILAKAFLRKSLSPPTARHCNCLPRGLYSVTNPRSRRTREPADV